jgi:hypothetical protein
MKISEYVKNYTSGDPVFFHHVILEVKELIVEVTKRNYEGIKEEFEDVFHFLQLWLFWRFKLDGEIWKITKHSVKKFMDRKLVWNKIYVSVSLPENISGYVGNYKKLEKVINHLQRFGIDRKAAIKAHNEIVINNQ